MIKDELVDVYDINKNKTGKIKNRYKEHSLLVNI